MTFNKKTLLKLGFNLALAAAMTLMVSHYVTAWTENDTIEIRIDHNNSTSFEGIIEIVAQPMIPIGRREAFNYQIHTFKDGSQGITLDLDKFENGLFNLQASLLNKQGKRQNINLKDSVVFHSSFLPDLQFKIHSTNLQTDVLLEGSTEPEIEAEIVTTTEEIIAIEEASIEPVIPNDISETIISEPTEISTEDSITTPEIIDQTETPTTNELEEDIIENSTENTIQEEPSLVEENPLIEEMPLVEETISVEETSLVEETSEEEISKELNCIMQEICNEQKTCSPEQICTVEEICDEEGVCLEEQTCSSEEICSTETICFEEEICEQITEPETTLEETTTEEPNPQELPTEENILPNEAPPAIELSPEEPTLEITEVILANENPSLKEDLLVSSVTVNIPDENVNLEYQWQTRQNEPDFYQKTYLQDVKISNFWEEISEKNDSYIEGLDAIEIGFPFNFYTDTFETIYPYQNGFLSFNELEEIDSWENSPNSLIMPFALSSDILTDINNLSVKTALVDESPERKRIIEWEIAFNNKDEILMQAQLLEGSDAIRFVYKKLPSNITQEQISLGVKEGKTHETELNPTELSLEKIQDTKTPVILRPGSKFENIENANLPSLEATKLQLDKSYRVIITPKAQGYKYLEYYTKPITVRIENIEKENDTPTEDIKNENTTEDVTENNILNDLIQANYNWNRLPNFNFQISFDNKLKKNDEDFLLFTDISIATENPIIAGGQILLRFPEIKDQYSDYTIPSDNLWIQLSRSTYENYQDDKGYLYFLIPNFALDGLTIYLELPYDMPAGVFDIYGEIAS